MAVCAVTCESSEDTVTWARRCADRRRLLNQSIAKTEWAKLCRPRCLMCEETEARRGDVTGPCDIVRPGGGEAGVRTSGLRPLAHADRAITNCGQLQPLCRGVPVPAVLEITERVQGKRETHLLPSSRDVRPPTGSLEDHSVRRAALCPLPPQVPCPVTAQWLSSHLLDSWTHCEAPGRAGGSPGVSQPRPGPAEAAV